MCPLSGRRGRGLGRSLIVMSSDEGKGGMTYEYRVEEIRRNGEDSMEDTTDICRTALLMIIIPSIRRVANRESSRIFVSTSQLFKRRLFHVHCISSLHLLCTSMPRLLVYKTIDPINSPGL